MNDLGSYSTMVLNYIHTCICITHASTSTVPLHLDVWPEFNSTPLSCSLSVIPSSIENCYICSEGRGKEDDKLLKILSNGSRIHSRLYTSSILYRYRGTAQSLCSWSATACTMWTLLKHQALTSRTPWAVGSQLMPDSDQVNKHTSVVHRPRV